jgi:phytoene desaturase
VASAIIVGAGIGGLAAAMDLVAKGVSVDVFESHSRVGGKAGISMSDGVAFDTGPSILTMPDVFDALFDRCGQTFRDRVSLVVPSPVFRYVYPDDVSVDVHLALEDTLDSVADSLGTDARDQLAAFLKQSKKIWDIAGPQFVYGPAPTVGHVLSLGPAAWLSMTGIDAHRTMLGAIRKTVKDRHLRWLLARYATYNGSDPRTAPATLNCIAWVELGLGGYGVSGGMHALTVAMADVIREQGGRIHLNAPVSQVLTDNNRAVGVRVHDTEHLADAVIINADVAHLIADLLPRRLPTPKTERSTSGFTAVVRSRSRPERAAHTVVFPADYDAEFADMFDARRPPQQPTVYACAQSIAHERPGWADAEPVFLMANAPATDEDVDYAALREQVMSRAIAAGLVSADEPVVWERTPSDLAAQYPRTGGAIYGAASTDRFAAFRRPNNRTSVPGLFLASGSAHPGGGVPLCALSGIQAAKQVLRDVTTAR